MIEEDKVPTISVITNETIDLEKGYDRYFYVVLSFKKEGGVNRRYEQAVIDPDLDEERIKFVRLNNKIEHH